MEFLPLEAAVMDMLLAGDHPSLQKLRTQVAVGRIKSRQSTGGAGFFLELEVPGDAERPAIKQRSLHITDVTAKLPELTRRVAFILMVREGCLAMLEAQAQDEEWPETVTTFELRYTDPSRGALLDALDE
jgi:hypothetical protein